MIIKLNYNFEKVIKPVNSSVACCLSLFSNLGCKQASCPVICGGQTEVRRGMLSCQLWIVVGSIVYHWEKVWLLKINVFLSPVDWSAIR